MDIGQKILVVATWIGAVLAETIGFVYGILGLVESFSLASPDCAGLVSSIILLGLFVVGLYLCYWAYRYYYCENRLSVSKVSAKCQLGVSFALLIPCNLFLALCFLAMLFTIGGMMFFALALGSMLDLLSHVIFRTEMNEESSSFVFFSTAIYGLYFFIATAINSICIFVGRKASNYIYKETTI